MPMNIRRILSNHHRSLMSKLQRPSLHAAPARRGPGPARVHAGHVVDAGQAAAGEVGQLGAGQVLVGGVDQEPGHRVIPLDIEDV